MLAVLKIPIRSFFIFLIHFTIHLNQRELRMEDRGWPDNAPSSILNLPSSPLLSPASKSRPHARFAAHGGEYQTSLPFFSVGLRHAGCPAARHCSIIFLLLERWRRRLVALQQTIQPAGETPALPEKNALKPFDTPVVLSSNSPQNQPIYENNDFDYSHRHGAGRHNWIGRCRFSR